MQLNEVSVVKEATSASEANLLLSEGWTLLGFVESSKHGAVTYVLGKPAAKAKGEFHAG